MSASSPLHLITFAAERAKLVSFASARGTIPASGDLGYAFHQVLAETFGAAAPKPFQIAEDGSWGVVAYSSLDAEALREAALTQREAAVPAWQLASEAIGLASMTSTPMPSNWVPAQDLAFSVRTRPVCRISHHRERGLPRECDVFLRAVASKSGEGEWLAREDVYLAWFREQIPEAAATLPSVRLTRFKLTGVYRKGAPRLDGPDATFSGVLRPAEPEAFLSLLHRGIGRHRAFGFGMILLGAAPSQ